MTRRGGGSWQDGLMEIVGAEPPSAERIRERHDRLLARLRAAAEADGHDPDRLRIVAVTKTWPVDIARAAVDAGLIRLGESRVQEAEPKIEALPEAEWHFIGRLQSNKARRAVRAFGVIHSVDSLELLRRTGELMAEEGRSPQLLVQVNVTGEEAKAGMPPEALLASEAVALLTEAGVIGLMTIAPMGASTVQARGAFRQ